jgi:hypothetical protein
MRKRRSILLILFIVASVLHAQDQIITPETRANADTIRRWLHSSDPRLIAWGADFARRDHEATVVTEMPEMLEHWIMPASNGGDESQAALRRAVLAVLDTLIQDNIEVPVPAIEAVATSFPDQAVILIARLPIAQSRSTLESWTYGATGSSDQRTLARAASMMLAKDPLPSRVVWKMAQVGFVASVIDASEEEVHITLIKKQAGYSLGGWNSCGDFLGHRLTPGWPQVYRYSLDETNGVEASGPVIIDLDGDKITFRRVEDTAGGGSCSGSGFQWLDPFTRHRLLAYWLGIPEGEMSWKPVESYTIVWTNQVAYQKELGEIVDAQRRKLNATVEALRQRGLLQKNEEAMPRLVVTIQCEMKPCPLQ